MSELARFYGIIIAIYFHDFGRHKTPHIHVSYAGEEAVLAIEDGRLLVVGSRVPKLALRLAREWLKSNREEVLKAWRAAKAGEGVKRIGHPPEFGRKRHARRKP